MFHKLSTGNKWFDLEAVTQKGDIGYRGKSCIMEVWPSSERSPEAMVRM